MAMSVNSMAKKIVSNLQGKKLAAENTDKLSDWATAISEAVIDEIKANAVVTSASISVPGSGLSAPNGAVTGSATGKLTDGKIA
jgi:hypothetical protein